jgi:hypothetical protein
MKSTIIAVLVLGCILVSFILGFCIYGSNHKYKFTQIKKGMKLSEARTILGKPDESKYFEGDIMDVYYYFPAEERFFYSRKDSLLNRSWRTDFD